MVTGYVEAVYVLKSLQVWSSSLVFSPDCINNLNTKLYFALLWCRITFQCLGFSRIPFVMTLSTQNQRKKSTSQQLVYLVSKHDVIWDSSIGSRSLSQTFFCSATGDERELDNETSKNKDCLALNLLIGLVKRLVKHGWFPMIWSQPAR